MRILDAYLATYVDDEITKISKEQIAHLETIITEMFLFALIWSIGTTSNLEGRIKFDKWFRDNRLPMFKIDFPEEKLIFDYQFSLDNKEWVYWMNTIKEY